MTPEKENEKTLEVRVRELEEETKRLRWQVLLLIATICIGAVSSNIRFNRVYDNFSDLRKECITTLNHSGYSFNFWGYDNSETEKIFNEYVEKMNGDKDEGSKDQKKKSS